MNTIRIPQILDSESLLECISKLIAQYKEPTYQRCNEQHIAAAGQESTSSLNVAAGTESAPPATERRSTAQAAAAAAARREPVAAYAGKELTTSVTRRQPSSYAEVVSNSCTKPSEPPTDDWWGAGREIDRKNDGAAAQPQAKIAVRVTEDGQPRNKNGNRGGTTGRAPMVNLEGPTDGGNVRGAGNFAGREGAAPNSGGNGFGFKPNSSPKLCQPPRNYAQLKTRPHSLKGRPSDY